MIAIFDFIPKTCPNCGKKLFPTPPHEAIREYNESRIEFTCSCGLQFRKGDTKDLLDLGAKYDRETMGKA